VPFHKSGKAYLYKTTVNYDVGFEQSVSWSDFLETGLVEEERIKLSHHPDGFVQFSGPGVFSGRNEDATIRGMGVMSQPLNRIFDGPAFAYGIQDVADLSTIDKVNSNSFILDLDEYFSIDNTKSVTVEAHYFVPMWRRFIRYDHLSRPVIRINHPCGAILEMRVFCASLDCDIAGFLGFEVYRYHLDLPQNGYSFGGPSGNMRLNADNQRLGDTLNCIYPRHEKMPVDRSLNYPQRPINNHKIVSDGRRFSWLSKLKKFI
jgi:hypothetical protein